MANWVGTSRSNYFRVKDEAAFLARMADFEVTVVNKGDGSFALISATEDGDWPSYDFAVEEDEDGEFPVIWFPDAVRPHIADDDVAVFMTIGAEKARYVTGVATAIHKDQSISILLDDIYNKASEQFGILPSEAVY